MVNVKPSVPDLSINFEDEKEEAAHLGLNFDYRQHRPEVEMIGNKSPDYKEIEILNEIARINQRLQLNGLKDNHVTKETSPRIPTSRNGKETSPKEKSASRFSVSPSSSGKSSRDLVYDFASLNAAMKKQDEKIDKLADKVQLLLSLTLKKREPEKRSIGTMTNFPVKSRPDKSVTPRRVSERSKKKISDSGLITSESESRSDGSELRSRSKVREEFYEKILRNVDQRLSNSRSEQSDSLSSNSPPRVNRSLPTSSKTADEFDLINKLAEKYLKDVKGENNNNNNNMKTSRRGLIKKTSLSEGEEQKLRRSKRSSRHHHQPVTVSDFTEEPSIGAVNYFEKYGLYDN